MIQRFPNGEIHYGTTIVSISEYIGYGGERLELKHLSRARKIKRSDSLSSGERKGKSLNLQYVITCVCCTVGVVGFKRLKNAVLGVAVLLFS